MLSALTAPAVSLAATVVPRIAAAVATMRRSVALVLDHVELLANVQSLDAIAALAVQLPSGSQLALGSRTRPPLPEGLQRAQGRMVEVGVEELAMDRLEARALLGGWGCGWPRRRWPSSSGGPRAGRWGCTWRRWPARQAAHAGPPEPGSPATTG